jgi:hypothetical protein
MTRRFLVPLSSDHVDYNIDSSSENSEGRLRWDSDFGTLSIGMEGGDVELPIGQKNGAYVKNTSGVNIGKGKAVQFAGAQGGKIEVEKAISDGTVPSKYMFGITAEEIDDDEFGFVVTEGYIRGVNTSGLQVGDLLYFDPNTPGNLTATEPPSTGFNIPIAAVTFVNASAGVIYVRMNMEYELKEIEDIQLTNLQNGDVLTYNSASAFWINAPATGGGGGGGGAKGGGTDEIFWENGQSITTNYTITTQKNAGTFGPVEIEDGVTVEIPVGSTWTIV